MVNKIKKQQQLDRMKHHIEGEESNEELLTLEIEDDEEKDIDDELNDEKKSDEKNFQEEDSNIVNCIRTLRFLQLLCEGHHIIL